jgi:hypothetical protein
MTTAKGGFGRRDLELWPERTEYPTVEAWADALLLRLQAFDARLKVRTLIDRPGVHVVGDTGEPAFQNSWTGDFVFRIDELGVVHLTTNLANVGTPGAALIMTLPEGYRPLAAATVPAWDTGAALLADYSNVLNIATDGQVTYTKTGTAATVALRTNLDVIFLSAEPEKAK